MKVIVPYTNLESETKAAVPDSEFIYVGSDELQYYRVLCDIWSRQESFVLVEHDIVPWDGAIQELESCTQMWCMFAYQYPGYPGNYLNMGNGCTKYDKWLMDMFPDMMVESNRNAPIWHFRPGHWTTLDCQMGRQLHAYGINGPHIHWPEVTHLHLPNRYPH